MQITQFKTVEDLNIAGADFMVSHLKSSEDKLLCAATGNSATGIYQNFAGRRGEVDTQKINIIKLDEWAGLPMDHHGSCEHYVQQYLLKPLNVPVSNYVSFNSMAANPVTECARISEALQTKGPIEVCILGLGLNGHIAFNDPDTELQPGVHLAKLSDASMGHPMVQSVKEKPTRGYTLGMADILQSKVILLVVHGKHKSEIFKQFSRGIISTLLPASFLWLHANVHCYFCEY